MYKIYFDMEGSIVGMSMKYKRFRDINLDDCFFDSLKEGYSEFEEWFKRKADQYAYIMENDNNSILAFLYLKIEKGIIDDIIPPRDEGIRLKVGTFKIDSHGTRLGERFIKKIFDYALVKNVKEIYVTVFEEHEPLIKLFQQYGFVKEAVKVTRNGSELVLFKNMQQIKNNVRLSYPLIKSEDANKYLLAIYPEYHTKLFPDSILNNETYDIIQDVSHTNSIHKVYISFMNLGRLNAGDIIIIYRTSDQKAPARYRSVVTSVCVVEEVRSKYSFSNIEDYVRYCEKYSIFKREALLQWYYNKKNVYVLRMTYNAAFKRRITRGILIDYVGLNENAYWGCMTLTDNQFNNIMKLGEVNEGIIIN